MKKYAFNIGMLTFWLPTKLLLIMKLIIVLLFACLMQVSAAGFAQKVTLNKRMLLKEALREIRVQSGYNILYDADLLKNATRINVNLKDASIDEALKSVLTDQKISYAIKKNTVILEKKTPSILDNIIARFQNIDVKGRILDQQKNPLPGATIKVKGSSQSVVTNERGEFLLRNINENAVLIIAYVGYVPKELNAAKDLGDIVLLLSDNKLEEVMVVGYGVQQKATMTSAVSQVSGEELQRNQSPNLSQKLAGVLPGITAFNTSGEPGQDAATLTVRGFSTINGATGTTNNNGPLIVIDGIVRASLSYIDPNDIASVSVLKDAAATAVYGARAANGALLITTKRGDDGNTTISYTGNFGVQEASKITKTNDAYTFASLTNLAYQNDGTFAPTYFGTRGFNAEALAAIQSGSDPNRYANTNWYKLFYGTSPNQQSHNVSVSGGTPKSRYFVSGGYLQQNGFWAASDFKRYNIRANLDGKIANNFDFTLNISGRRQVSNNIDKFSGPNNYTISQSPLSPVQYTDGKYVYFPATGGNVYLDATGQGGYNNGTTDILESSATLSYKVPFIPGLAIKGLYSFDITTGFTKVFVKPYTSYLLNDDNTRTIPASVASATASLTEAMTRIQSITSEFSLNYNRTFLQDHNVSALLLYTETSNMAEGLNAKRVNFPSPALDQLSLGNTTGATNGNTALQNGRRSIVGRLTYNYKEKYLFEFSSRYDGSDLFPPDHRYGFFPAVSIGWRLSEEKFIKDHFSFVSNLKIRGSWGKAGNDAGGAFQYLSTYSIPSNSYGFGGISGQVLVPGVIPNQVFTWETATTTDIGLEAALWNNLLGINADYFYKRTSNILSTPAEAVPGVLGGTLPIGNYGIVDNSGFEIELTHQNTIGQVSYYAKPNITFNKSKVIYYPEAASTPDATRLTGKSVSLNPVVGYLANGLYQSMAEITSGPTPLSPATKPGDIKYVDVNQDGKITASDKVLLSSGLTPHIILGLNTGAKYKNFDVNMIFQGALQVQNVLNLNIIRSNLFPWATDSWTPTNPGASHPRLTNVSNFDNSSLQVRNGAYMRMKSLELGYTLPKEWLSKLSIGNARLFVSGTNLFTLSHLKDFADPESGLFATPLMKLYNVGVNVKFN
ncbi:SusC/RagA family TonB-linked outer membrane protein [Pedobacter hiemivivus]|uniref:SusC/RagA family TonB-linked outer membrane protein n=2 Tax=Pedobacter hiemivivus TaxID=2530454 RepID=A0A4R0NAD1_9SPHI|nr:SusC/RagA family TonB-linked outer membrane protein [Pedobacter hiemivivus]